MLFTPSTQSNLISLFLISLIITQHHSTDPPASYSTVGPFPGGSEYAPYNAPSYVWNKAAGTNSYPFSSSWFPMPVFLLTPELAADAQQRAAYNAKQVSSTMQSR
jgi:hypothetical protein